MIYMFNYYTNGIVSKIQAFSAIAMHMAHLTHAEDRSTCIVPHASAIQVPYGIIRTTPKPVDLQSQWGSTVIFVSVKGL